MSKLGGKKRQLGIPMIVWNLQSVVVLSPDMTRKQNVEAGEIVAPGDVIAHLHPFAVLVEHARDDVDESFIRIDQSVPSGEQVAFQPSLALVLR